MGNVIVYVYEPSGNNLSEQDIKHGERLQDFCDYHDGLNKWVYIVVDHSGIKCNRHVLLTMALEGKVGKVVMNDITSLGKNEFVRNEYITFLLEKNIELLTPSGVVKGPKPVKVF